MAGPAFAGRRARSRFGQLAAFGAVVMLVSAALAVLGGAIAPVLATGTRAIVQQSGPTASALRLQATLSADPDAQDAEVAGVVEAAFGDIPVSHERTVSGPADALVDGDPVVLQLLADPAIREHAELTAGEWPTSPDQAAVQDAAAAELSLTVGDTLTVGEHTLTVSGLWRATDPAAARWFGDPAVASGREGDQVGPVLVDEAVLEPLPQHPDVRWTLLPGPATLGASDLPALADAIVSLDGRLRQLGGGNESVSIESSLADSISRATRVSAVAAGVLGLPIVLVAVAGAIVLSLIARAIAAGRGGEFVLLRARGASLRAITLSAARESGAVALVAAAVGAGLGLMALLVGLPVIGAPGQASIPLVAGIGLGVALLAVVLVVIVTQTELRAPVSGRAESGRAAVIASLAPLALTVVAAGFALAQFLSLGAPVVVRGDGRVRTDPLALTAPVLVLLALALAAPAIAGPVVAVAERFARGARGILPVLPLRQLARRARSVAAGVLVIALAAGSVVVAASFHLGAANARDRAEHAATGSDLRVVLPVRSSVEVGRPGATAALVEGAEGVESAFPVFAGVASIGADAVPIVAGDAGLLASTDPAQARLAALTDALSSSRPGREIPAGTTSLTAVFDVRPSPEVPEGLSFDVVVWVVDDDGTARRIALGTAPVIEGAVEVTGDIPPSAVTLLAVELKPPALEAFTYVGVALTELRSSSGVALAFEGDADAQFVTGGQLARLLPQGQDRDPVPVAIGRDLADLLGSRDGDEVVFRISGISGIIRAQIVGVVDVVPGASGSSALLIDLPTLQARAVALGGSVPAANEVWVATGNPDAAAAAVRDVLTTRAGIVTARTLSPAPVLDPTVLLVEFGVVVTVLLAMLGFAAVAASISQRRRAELTPLRSLGLSPTRIRRARAIELVAAALLALLLGVAAGLATAALVVPGLVGVLT